MPVYSEDMVNSYFFQKNRSTLSHIHVYRSYICVHMPVYSEDMVNSYFFQKRSIDTFTHTYISIIHMNVQCSCSYTHSEALHVQLQMDRFRYVNYQKFVTKGVILHIRSRGSNQILCHIA